MKTEMVFSLNDAELRVLCVFFLAAPLPPLASVVGPFPTEKGHDTATCLRQAMKGLAAKRLLITTPEGKGEVVHDLADMLRQTAYSLQYTILSWHERGTRPQMMAFYSGDGVTVAHEVTSTGEHRLEYAEAHDLGFARLQRMLKRAVPGEEGERLSLPQPLWERILAARLQGKGGSEALLVMAPPGEEVMASSEVLKGLAQAVLEAPWVVSVQVVYDSLAGQGETASFVLGAGENWLILPGRGPHGENAWLWGLKARRDTLQQSARALFAPLREPDKEEE